MSDFGKTKKLNKLNAYPTTLPTRNIFTIAKTTLVLKTFIWPSTKKSRMKDNHIFWMCIVSKSPQNSQTFAWVLSNLFK